VPRRHPGQVRRSRHAAPPGPYAATRSSPAAGSTIRPSRPRRSPRAPSPPRASTPPREARGAAGRGTGSPGEDRAASRHRAFAGG